ncbi:MAG: asparagine synthase [Rhodanobacteraceae bacterium]|nr:asparagine synthase [Rhodanobacteraceae bacterium]
MPIVLVRFAPDGAPAGPHWQRACERARTLAPPFDGQQDHRSGAGWNALVVRVSDVDPAGFHDSGAPGVVLLASYARPTWPLQPPSTAGLAIGIDRTQRCLTATCDLTGRHGLYWCEARGEIWLSTRIELLLLAPGLATAEDPGYFASYYANCAAPDDRTAYRDIRLIPGGAWLRHSGRRCHVSAHERVPAEAVETLPAKQRREHLRSLVGRAVASCLPEGAGTAGLLLSGGFDSAWVLRTLVRIGHPRVRIECATAGYRHRRVADERKLAENLRKSLAVPGFDLDAAQYPPRLADLGDIAAPCANPFRRLNDALYSGLRTAAARVVLTGQFADELDAPGHAWLREWRQHKTLDSLPLWALLRQPAEVARHLVNRLGLRRAGVRHDDCLLAAWREWLQSQEPARLMPFQAWPRPSHAADVLGSAVRESELLEARHVESQGLLSMHPFRDWELVRFLLSLPARDTAVLASRKRIQRAAARDLPASVLRRKKCGSLEPLLSAAMASLAPQAELILREVPAWRGYLAEGALQRLAPRNPTELYMVFRMLAHSLWAEPGLLRTVAGVEARHR